MGTADESLSDYCLTIGRRGGNGAQGSENCFHNCHFSGAAKACYLQHGYNALNNQFFGGNFQLYERCGAEIIFGSAHFYGVGFQSTSGARQLDNDGWDIKADSGGVSDALVVSGCRTESLRFVKAGGSQPPSITACNHRPALNYWSPGLPVQAADGVQLDGQLYRARFAHADTEWIASHWDRVDFNCVEMLAGTISNSRFALGSVAVYHNSDNYVHQTSVDYRFPIHGVDAVLVDASKNDVAIDLPSESLVTHGKTIEVFRGDKNTKTNVIIRGQQFNNDWLFVLNLDTRKNRSVRLRALGGGTIPRRWCVV